MADGTIEIGLEINTKTGETSLKGFETKARKAGKKAGRGFSGGFESSLGGLFSAAGKVSAVLGTVFAAVATKGAFDAAKSIEKIETQFEILTGSAAAAQKQVEDLVKFAATTPFQLEGLADATSKLLAFGFQQDQIAEKLRVLGDVAAGSNTEIGEVSRIFGQISAAGRLTGERLLQLEERAIPIGPALAQSMGVAEGSIRELVRTGKVGFADVEKALQDMTSAGGLFANATVKQSKTLGGLVSTLKDNIFALQVAIGKALGPAFKVIVADAIGLFASLTKGFKENQTEIIKGLASFGRGVVQFIVAPTELAYNIVRNTFSGLAASFDFLVGTIKSKLGTVGLFLENLGISNKLTEELTKAGEEGTAVLEESFAEFRRIKEDTLNFPASVKVDEYISELERAASESQAPLDKIVKQTKKATKAVSDTVKATGTAITQTVQNAIVKTMSLGIQHLTKALITGKGSFEAFGKAVAGTLGSLATQLGETLIGAGLGIEALKGLQGAAAIAAGAGLIALGAILSSLGEGGASPTGGGGGAVAGGLSAPDDSEITDPAEEEERVAQQTVQLVVQGDILNSDTGDLGRRLVDILNDNFEREGSVLTGARFA